MKNNPPLEQFELELLWCFVLGISRASFRAWPERQITEDQRIRFNTLVERRVSGEPIAYLLGEKEFWSLSLDLNAHVLIPRPETELLVETLLDKFSNKSMRVLDLGTGSGAIALALASERSAWQLIAVDQSLEALSIAKANAKKLNIPNINFACGNWYEPVLEQSFDIIVSNPPYIAIGDPHLVEGDCRFEPKNALVSGVEGLDDLKKIITNAPNHLFSKGWILVEHGYNQSAAVLSLFKKSGFKNCCVLKDLAYHDRVVMGQWI